MATKGSAGFEDYYAECYGPRWPSLKAALTAPVRQIARLNRFAAPGSLESRFPQNAREQFGAVEWVAATPSLSPELDTQNLADCYLMDLGSIFPPLLLGAQPGERILDMCAAPGGKTLVLAESMGASGELIANEISDNRRSRLVRVIREYVPRDVRDHVYVTGHDAARWCLHEPQSFDRILLDAPCSGERHLLADPGELKKWSEARTKNLAVRQYALLASALGAVKPGGRIVYSTCALSPRENDDIIARLLKRRAGEARVLSFQPSSASASPSPLTPPPIGEATQHGWMILPDTTGYGPIYLAVLERTDVVPPSGKDDERD